MKENKRYIKTYSKLLTIDEYLTQYHSELGDQWGRIQETIDKAFNIKSESDYEDIKYWFSSFNYEKMMMFYNKIMDKLSFFDDDILRFISFIAAVDYFEQIGNPSLEIWINSKSLNTPFEQIDEQNGYSLTELIGLKYGNNAMRHLLLSTWSIVTGEFGGI